MSPHFFSSIVFRALVDSVSYMGAGRVGIRNGEKFVLEKGLTFEDKYWAEAMMKKYCPTNDENPVVILTEEESARALDYLTRYGEVGADISEEAMTVSMRCDHAVEMRDFLKTKYHDSPEFTVWGFLPEDNGVPKCFEEWFALYQVWRLSLGVAENPYIDAVFGTSECRLGALPKLWVDKLDECVQITDASADLPTPWKGRGRSVTRQDLNSVLPTWESNPRLSGLFTGAIIDRWFGIIRSQRDQRKLGRTEFVHPDNSCLFNATPQQLADRKLDIDPDISMIFFPTVIKEQKHCILVVALPKDREMVLYDSLGLESTTRLREKLPWIQNTGELKDKQLWAQKWRRCPEQMEADACGVFMLINAKFVADEKQYVNGLYSQKDVPYLRRYIAATICMGAFPD